MTRFFARLQIASAFLGNLFEHYDLALYSLLSPFFATLFFSNEDRLLALILTYLIIPIGMLTRPFGALVFGYIGDHYGRQKALFISLTGLAIVSLLLAFTPTYNQAGWVAAIYLTIGRMLQNFFGIGENLGGGIYLLENTPKKNQNFISSLYSSSTVAGFFLASIGVSLLCYYHLLDTYWRVLYLFGGTTALFGSILRKNFHNAFTEVKITQMASPLKETFSCLWTNKNKILLIALIAGFSYTNASITLVFFNGFIPLVSQVTTEEMVHLNTFLLLFDLITLPIVGLIANRFSRQKMMLFSSLSILCLIIPIFSLFENATLYEIILIRFFIVLLGVFFTAPFHAWAQNLVPATQRYTIISFGYALGTQILGGPSAPFSLWIYQQTQNVQFAALYWFSLACLVSSTFLFIVYKKREEKIKL